MQKTLVACGLAAALLAPCAAGAHATLDHDRIPPRTSPTTLAVVAAGGDMRGHDTGTTATAGDIAVEGAWARETTLGARAGAVYLTIDNGGDTDDRLVGAASEAAGRAGLHTHLMEDGVMKMRPVEAVDVPAHGGAALKPGGFHVMLTGLKERLKQGATFPLTLDFEKAGKVEVRVKVEDIGYQGGHAP